MRILIGYDGSECADAALDDLRRAGLPNVGEALILSVADTWPQVADPPMESMPGSGGWMLPAIRNTRELIQRELGNCFELANRAADRLRGHLPGWAITVDAVADSPVTALVIKADEWRPDLVVVGSHGRTGPGRLILGSVSQGVLVHARCSVRIARRGSHREGKPIRILVGIDDSVAAATALSAISMRNWPAGTEVRVVAAIDSATGVNVPVFGLTSAWLPQQSEDPYRWVQQAMDQVARELRESGLQASALASHDNPKKALVQEAEKWQADCIFVGARGLRGIERILLGSVSAAVAARAHCSVEVVRQAPGKETNP